MDQLDDLLGGLDVTLSDEILDRIDEIVLPGTDIGTLDQAYLNPAIGQTHLRRRPVDERAATWSSGAASSARVGPGWSTRHRWAGRGRRGRAPPEADPTRVHQLARTAGQPTR
jgi:hypothetical protein